MVSLFRWVPVLLALLAVGCQAQTYSLERLGMGIPYSEARQIILDAGWEPVAVPAADRDEYAAREREMAARGWTEVVSCAGTGVAPCRFEFTTPRGDRLVVITEGEGDDPPANRFFHE